MNPDLETVQAELDLLEAENISLGQQIEMIRVQRIALQKRISDTVTLRNALILKRDPLILRADALNAETMAEGQNG